MILKTVIWNNKTILIAEDKDSNFRYFNMVLSETNINIACRKRERCGCGM